MTHLDQMTQQNAALVEESTAAAASMRDQAQRLAEVVSVFNVGAVAARAPAAAPRAAAAPRPAPAAARVGGTGSKPVSAAKAPVAARLAGKAPAAPKVAPAPSAASSSAPAPRAAAGGNDDEWESF